MKVASNHSANLKYLSRTPRTHLQLLELALKFSHAVVVVADQRRIQTVRAPLDLLVVLALRLEVALELLEARDVPLLLLLRRVDVLKDGLDLGALEVDGVVVRRPAQHMAHGRHHARDAATHTHTSSSSAAATGLGATAGWW